MVALHSMVIRGLPRTRGLSHGERENDRQAGADDAGQQGEHPDDHPRRARRGRHRGLPRLPIFWGMVRRGAIWHSRPGAAKAAVVRGSARAWHHLSGVVAVSIRPATDSILFLTR